MRKLFFLTVTALTLLGIVASMAVPALAETTSPLSPSAVGHWDNWPLVPETGDKVDAVSDDVDASYIHTGIQNFRQTFTFDGAGVPLNAIIDSVTINAMARKYRPCEPCESDVFLYLIAENGPSGADIRGNEPPNQKAVTSETYETVSRSMTTNPFTDAAWTLSEVNAWTMNFGVQLANKLEQGVMVRVTQISVVVDYTTNQPPVANDDIATTGEDTPVDIYVLDNDSDPDGDDLLYVKSATHGDHGMVNNNISYVTYYPDVDWYGIDTFEYTASDGNGGFDDATVTVTVIEADIIVDPTAGLVTTESGVTDTFDIWLTTKPTADVTVELSSDDTNEGTVSPASVTFTPENWYTHQTVTVTGVNDSIVDGDIPYKIITAPATSADDNYKDMDADDVGVTNLDNDTRRRGGGFTSGGDFTPPVISGVIQCYEGVTETTADICWITNESGTSQVEYRASPSLLSPLDEKYVIEHHVRLEGLTPGTTYYYKTMSRDRAGNMAVSPEYTFTTLGELPVTEPPATEPPAPEPTTPAAPEPTAPPEEAAPAEVQPSINWALIGGIIAAVLVIAGLVFFFWRRRRAEAH